MGVKEDLDNLRDEVAAQKTVAASVVSLVKGLQAQLATALENVATADDSSEFEDEIQAIHDSLAANTKEIADAVTSGTAGTVAQPVPQGATPNGGGLTSPEAVAAASPDLSQVASGEVAGASPAPSPAQPAADAASVNTPGTAGDPQTGNVDSAGASPNDDNSSLAAGRIAPVASPSETPNTLGTDPAKPA